MNRNKLLVICLLLSLTVNLFLIGGIVSRTMDRPERGTRPFPPNVSWLMRGLSEERREQLVLPQAANVEASRLSRSQMSARQLRVNELMAADPVDAEAIAQAFAELRQAYSEYQQMSHQQTIDMLMQLTVAERQQALEFLSSRRSREDGNRRPGSRPPSGPLSSPPIAPPARPDSIQPR